MPYEIQYDKEKNIAELILSNPASLEETKKAGKEAVSFCHSDKTKCVLVDMEKIITKESLNILNLYELGLAWRHENGNGAIKYAVILPMDRKSKEDINFLITIGKPPALPGDSHSLTITGLVGKSLDSEPLKVQEKETSHVRRTKFKPYQVGMQVSRGMDSEIS